jgi:hypothetical protein
MQTIAGCLMILAGLATVYTSGFDFRTMSIRDHLPVWAICFLGYVFFWVGAITATAGFWGLKVGIV